MQYLDIKAKNKIWKIKKILQITILLVIYVEEIMTNANNKDLIKII